jgi:hypothetical protein
MLLVLSLVLAAMPPSPCLQLSLAVPKREILAGEATTAIVTAHAVCDLEAPGFRPSLQIDDGTGFRPFMDVQDDDGCVFDITRSIKAGSWARALRRLAVSENEPGFQLAFPKAGTYRVQASWRGVRSNVVHVIAVEPQGEDARVLEELGKAPELLSWIGFMDRPEKARDLVARYPASHYLVPVRIMLWQMEAVEAERRDEFGSMRFPTARTVAVLDQVESAEPSGTPFDLDRLLLVWTHRTVASDSAGATRVSERITREYPDSHNADWDYAARLAEAQERASHTGSSLGLELSAAKGRLLVGEAQKLTLSWIARRPTPCGCW